ncbi:MAG: PKD domain-containing protein [candidate division WOR-3 bacterium]
MYYTKSNRPPIITSISGDESVLAGGFLSLTCYATDPNKDPLEYNWTCTNGSFSSSKAQTVTWYAPSSSGAATISVTVRDNRGGQDSRSKTITVYPLTYNLIDWDGQIRARSYAKWDFSLQSGYTVSGSFWVDNYDINFLILDAANYENWRNNNSYSYIVRVLRSPGTSFSAKIPVTGTYYIILDNTFSIFTDKFAHLLLQATSP